MALYYVAAEATGCGHCPFEVDVGSCGEVAGAGFAEGLAADVESDIDGSDERGSEADTVYGDAVTECESVCDGSEGYGYFGACAETLDGFDLANNFDNTGKHG